MLMRKEEFFFDMIEENIKMTMTDEDEKNFRAAEYCSECRGKFSSSDIKVRDHGKFLSKITSLSTIPRSSHGSLPVRSL